MLEHTSKPPMISDPTCGQDSAAASLDMFNGDFSVYIDHDRIKANIIYICLL